MVARAVAVGGPRTPIGAKHPPLGVAAERASDGVARLAAKVHPRETAVVRVVGGAAVAPHGQCRVPSKRPPTEIGLFVPARVAVAPPCATVRVAAPQGAA